MASRRTRTTNHGVKDFDAFLDAIKVIKIYKQSIRKTAIKYKMQERSLDRYVKKFDAEVPDISKLNDEEILQILCRIGSYSNNAAAQSIFNEEQEKALVAYAIVCCKHYYGLSITEMKQLAYQYAKKIELDYHFSWEDEKMAGKQWYYGFMLRHKNTLSLQTPEQTAINRTKAFCQENVTNFFANLDAVLADTPFGPRSIWNMGETGFSTVLSTVGKVISLKGGKRVGQITSGERGCMITLAFAVNAIGNTLPPFYLFPRKEMSATYLEPTSIEAVGYANESGCMQQPEFVKFLKHFIQYTHSSKCSPTLLLLDNHRSHLSIEAIDLAVENGITMMSFPPRCSHRLQPLDMAVYGPVKGVYNQLHNAWMREHVGRSIDIMHIPMLMKTALLKGATAENIVAGFNATGISPFNPGAIKDSDYISLGIHEANEEATVIEREYNEEQQRRIIVSSEIKVVAHESVSTKQKKLTGAAKRKLNESKAQKVKTKKKKNEDFSSEESDD